ncbi:MAG: SAF domain-containing protein [Clostridiales Family XIII bacterium]|jgi:hypothetical protein|nr:SAF domain-containing protein [Clostridiales Family XIII bacterium]
MMTKTQILKTMTGALILLIAIALLVFWEAQGREIFLMDEVLVAKEQIQPGDAVAGDLFRAVRVPKDAVVEGDVPPGEAGGLAGMVADSLILKGAQLSRKQLKSADAAPAPETSCFVVKNDWIEMCTSSLRRGDTVDILSHDGRTDFGQFQVAFVKDSEGREVTDAQATIRAFTDPDEGRANASSPIHHIEVRCEWPAYKAVKDYCEKSGAGVLIIRREQA